MDEPAFENHLSAAFAAPMARDPDIGVVQRAMAGIEREMRLRGAIVGLALTLGAALVAVTFLAWSGAVFGLAGAALTGLGAAVSAASVVITPLAAGLAAVAFIATLATASLARSPL